MCSKTETLTAFQIPGDFQHKYSLLCLHVWMLLRRLKLEGKDGKMLSQIMYDNFQDDVEHMVRQAGVQIRLQKHLTELEKQFYGTCAAYDAALSDTPKETLANALHRNVYQGNPNAAKASKHLEKYVLREMACLSKTSSESIMSGRIQFP